jgi:hypothetical protein
MWPLRDRLDLEEHLAELDLGRLLGEGLGSLAALRQAGSAYVIWLKPFMFSTRPSTLPEAISACRVRSAAGPPIGCSARPPQAAANPEPRAISRAR